MGILSCPKCKHKVADTIDECPFCGLNIQEAIRFNRANYLSKEYKESAENQRKRSGYHKMMVWGWILIIFVPIYIFLMVSVKGMVNNPINPVENPEETEKSLYISFSIFFGIPAFLSLLFIYKAKKNLRLLNQKLEEDKEKYKQELELEDKMLKAKYEAEGSPITKKNEEDEDF